MESLVIYFGAFHLLDPWEYGLQTWIFMIIYSAEIGLTLCHLSILSNNAPVELLRDAVLFGKLSQEHACCKWNLASTVTEFGKPRRDLSTIAWKSLYKFAVTRTPRATWVPQMCSYVEEVLWNETCWWNCDNGSMKPIHIRKILSASVRVTPSVSLPCEQSTDSFLKTEESLFQWNFFSQISW